MANFTNIHINILVHLNIIYEQKLIELLKICSIVFNQIMSLTKNI